MSLGHLVEKLAAFEPQGDLPVVSFYLNAQADEHGRHARALIEQVATKGYSPSSREKVLEFQKQQQFSICPNPKDPDACNVYKDLKFPPEVYESITEYHEEKAGALG